MIIDTSLLSPVFEIGGTDLLYCHTPKPSISSQTDSYDQCSFCCPTFRFYFIFQYKAYLLMFMNA